MSINIPAVPIGPTGFYPLPSEYETALKEAEQLLATQADPSKDDEWQDAGNNQDVQLHRKDNTEDAYDVPWVKGYTVVESATPEQVLATIQLPAMRKKWDPRFEDGHPVQRYEPQSYLFYSVMKSPSYFIWARDIAGVQRNIYDHPEKGSITILQKSVENEEYLPDAGSYAKSRTRATVELSGWILKPKGEDTEVTYIVKVRLNGNIPTSVVSMLATETPMCVGRVRDVYYSTGFAPHDERRSGEAKTILATMEFEDGDGTEATAGERKWTGIYLAKGADEFNIIYDAKRMYTQGVEFAVEGDAKEDVKIEQNGEEKVKVTVDAKADGKQFQVLITPKE